MEDPSVTATVPRILRHDSTEWNGRRCPATGR